MGFALTNKLTLGFPSSSSAAGNLQRIIEYIDDGAMKYGSPTLIPRWIIMNPIRDRCVYGDDGYRNCSSGGALLYSCVYGAARTNQNGGFQDHHYSLIQEVLAVFGIYNKIIFTTMI